MSQRPRELLYVYVKFNPRSISLNGNFYTNICMCIKVCLVMLWNIVVMEEYYVKECSLFQCELYIFSVDSFYKNAQLEP